VGVASTMQEAGFGQGDGDDVADGVVAAVNTGVVESAHRFQWFFY
jgi:hypothetical protein